jgi:hypothetical protein
MRIEHKYERVEISPDAGCCHVWEVTITHNDKIYHAEISNVAYNVAYRHGDDYWSGFIHLDEYDEEGYEKLYINFNCQNVYNSLSCILIGIKEIINEDFSNVDSSGFYHSNINEIISNKCDILFKISHETLFDKITTEAKKWTY